MAFVKLENVSLDFPIYNTKTLSLRHNLLRLSTGGRISSEAGKTTVVRALEDINLDIKDGDSVGLIGHNGSGKSTLLRVLAGIYSPTGGEIHKAGKVTTVFELGAGIDPELTGKENILRVAMLQGADFRQAYDLLEEVTEFCGLGDFINLPVRVYSSGMTMRLMFGVATSVMPEIFLVDEMISTGDSDFQDKALKRMKDISKSSKIFVLASHDREMIHSMCNKIIRLEHGKIVEVVK